MTKRLFKNFLISLVLGIVIALATSIFTFATATVSLSYSITNLGSLGSGSCEALGINYASQVVGYCSISRQIQKAFLWQNGTMNSLDISGSLAFSYASAINSSGQVVYNTDPGSHVMGKKVILWQNGKTTNVNSADNSTIAYGLNNTGHVVGGYLGPAFLWYKGNMTSLGTLGGSGSGSVAYAINDSRQVVGGSQTNNAQSHAFLWQKGSIRDLGTLSGNYSEARSINKTAQVVGSSTFNNNSPSYVHAFLWENPKMKDLGTLGGNNSKALAINNSGTIVGKSEISSGIEHAFLWKHGKMTDLNSRLPTNSGWELTTANAINNRGQIVGKGKFNGETRAFLLTPVMVTN
ncbi:MAG: hypothetical protein U7123_05750 [Potamolinea sp.]